MLQTRGDGAWLGGPLWRGPGAFLARGSPAGPPPGAPMVAGVTGPAAASPQLPRHHPSCHARSAQRHIGSASRPELGGGGRCDGCAGRCEEPAVICLSVSRLCTWKSTIMLPL